MENITTVTIDGANTITGSPNQSNITYNYYNNITPIQINYKKLNEYAHEPTRGSEYAAGYDLYAAIPETYKILPYTTINIPTGLSFELPNNTFAAIFARSGLAIKDGLRPANCVGVCDSDYRGEYIVALYNDSKDNKFINPGDRIAQMILLPYIPMEFNEVEELNDTMRGDGGFGSTGV